MLLVKWSDFIIFLLEVSSDEFGIVLIHRKYSQYFGILLGEAFFIGHA